jgi:hypothetical protein
MNMIFKKRKSCEITKPSEEKDIEEQNSKNSKNLNFFFEKKAHKAFAFKILASKSLLK